MSQAHSGTESCIGSPTSPSIESGRFERAVTEDMITERVADRFYEVHSQSGNTYEIDLQTGACTCPDCEQRGDRFVYKYAIRASLVEIIANGVTMRTAAKVAGYARDPEYDCPAEGVECAGPPRATANSRVRPAVMPPAQRTSTSSTSGTASLRPIRTTVRTQHRRAPREQPLRARRSVNDDLGKLLDTRVGEVPRWLRRRWLGGSRFSRQRLSGGFFAHRSRPQSGYLVLYMECRANIESRCHRGM